MNIPGDALKAKAQALLNSNVPQPGEIYEHYKGGFYTIVATAIRENSLEPVVIYHSNLLGVNWERTLDNFTEMVASGIPRFMRWER